MKYKLFKCTDHDPHWCIGGASIVIESDKGYTHRLLDAPLREHGL